MHVRMYACTYGGMHILYVWYLCTVCISVCTYVCIYVCMHVCISGMYLKTILLQFTYLSSLVLTRNHNTTWISLENNPIQEFDTKYDGGAIYSDVMISGYVAYRWIPVKRSSWIKQYTTWVAAIIPRNHLFIGYIEYDKTKHMNTILSKSSCE